jgi:CheY-like chemotaxis protein
MGRQKKILIVEDETIFATSMQRVLIKSGYDVLEPVSTGEEAVKMYLSNSSQSPSLFLIFNRTICLYHIHVQSLFII